MEKEFEQNEGFRFYKTRLQRKTQKVNMISSSSDNNSESSFSIDEVNEIEIIKGKNRKMNKKIRERIMDFKYSSRKLMSFDSPDEVTLSPFPQCVDKDQKKRVKPRNADLSHTRAEKTEVTENKKLVKLLNTVGKLKTQHKRARSELDSNLQQILIIEQEKNSLKNELNQLQDKFFKEKNTNRRSSCFIF